jgi:hypothetical protein
MLLRPTSVQVIMQLNWVVKQIEVNEMYIPV